MRDRLQERSQQADQESSPHIIVPLPLNCVIQGYEQKSECPNEIVDRIHSVKRLRKTFGLNNIRDPVTGFTCLHHAALNGHSECVRLLLEHGAKPNSLDYKGSSALHSASWAGNLDVVRILLGSENIFSPCEVDRVSLNQQLEPQQQAPIVDFDLCNNDNQTPLSLAAQFGHHDVVGELLAFGANANIRNSQLESPLDLACLNGRLETVDLLLKSSSPSYPAANELLRPQSSIYLQQNSWSSPQATNNQYKLSNDMNKKILHRRPSASGSGTWSSLLLRSKSSSKDSPSEDEQSSPNSQASQLSSSSSTTLDPRRRATLSHLGANDMLEKLLDHSPLHYAVRRGHLDIIMLLLYKYNANLMQTTTRGSVLHEIASNGFGAGRHAEVIALIFDYIQNTISKENQKLYLDRFLNLKNAQMKNVFQLLNEINNRSANEIKRLIYGLSEKINDPSQQQHQMTDISVNSSAQNNNMRQFSDLQQVNSFLTIRRAQNISSSKQLPVTNILDGTQTIDRSYQPRHSRIGPPKLQQPQGLIQQHQQLQQQQQNYNMIGIYQPMMTRSVSNLSRLPMQPLDSEYNQMAELHLQRQKSSLDDRSRQSKSRDHGSLLIKARHMGSFDPHLYDNSFEAPPARRWQPNAQQQQQLVRSQTDCSHLNNNSIHDANYTESNTNILERKMINRHYHVYDHDFFPPRIQAQTQQYQQEMVAIVQPLENRNNFPEIDTFSNPALRSSTRSTASSSVQQQARGSYENRRAGQNDESLLSLNEMHHQQQQSMDRFLSRHSRKLNQTDAPSTVPTQIQFNRCVSVEQNRQGLAPDLQQQLLASETQKQLQRQVQSSCSFESHLSEPQLFESTRLTIMRDFDEMIERELLNRDHNQSASTQQNGSRSSTLTGVMLDMDRFGDRITVSGTLSNHHQLSPSQAASNSELVAAKRPTDESVNTKQRQVIYDLPGHLEIDKVTHGNGARYPSVSRGQSIAPAQASSQSATSRLAMTEPPKVRPPPPPISNHSSIASPLCVDAPTSDITSVIGTSSSISNNEQIGLLKMASLTSNSSTSSGSTVSSSMIRVPPLNREKIVGDPDSGVCTSNSPVSLSHEFEGVATISQFNSNTSGSIEPELVGRSRKSRSSRTNQSAVVRHMNRNQVVQSPFELKLATYPSIELSNSPPSPRTAQMCIEQALGSIDKKTHEMANQTVGDEEQKRPRTLSIIEESNKDPDYENCLALQQRLRQINCKSLRQLLIPDVDQEVSTNEDEDENEDEDYAESEAGSSSSSDHDSKSIIEPDESVNSVELRQGSNDKKREFMLRVVVDDDATKIEGTNYDHDVDFNLRCDDESDEKVFYIDPANLKGFVDPHKQPKDTLNASTLTDEDLCASVDKESGFIRFTLRKRRIHSEDNDLDDGSRTLPSRESIKKTKHNEEHGQHPNRQPDDNDLRAISLVQMKQWFTTNLVGLADYLSKFISDGFDSLDFLNHPGIINQETLSHIGIEEESHRLLIIESIQKSLARTDMSAIVSKCLNENDNNQPILSQEKLFGLLQITALDDMEDDIVCSQKVLDHLRSATSSYPFGHRLRLQGALEILSSNHCRESIMDRQLSKQVSTESSEAEIEASQISQVSTSSSSKESIKSIVSKTQIPDTIRDQTSEEPLDDSGEKPTTDVQKSIVAPSEDDVTKEVCTLEEENINPRAFKVWTSNRTSLVSEAARKLEMAAAAQESNKIVPARPIAAARKSTPAVAKIFDSKPDAAESRDNVRNVGPVKSICWPPVSKCGHDQQYSNRTSSDQQKSIVAQRSNRLSYQRSLFEEKSKAANKDHQVLTNHVGIKTGPKPAPPAKPAKLATSKFGIDLSNKP